MMPNYCVGSNTDKLGTGATNLAHRHYQSGLYDYPIYSAKILESWKTIDNAQIDWLDHPATSICISGSKEAVGTTCLKLLNGWREGTISNLNPEFQTISWLAKYVPSEENPFRIIMIPRNGDNPKFLTRPSLQCLKKEFLGIFEMVGYAILPGRLGDQLPSLERVLEQVSSSQGEYSTCLKNHELEPFQAFVDQFVVPQIKKNHSINESIQLALQEAFIAMLQDNSPIKYGDKKTILQWFNESKLQFI